MIGTIIWAIIGGGLLGALARLILPGRQNVSVWLTILVGIVAAFIGGVVAAWFGVAHTGGIDWIKHGIQLLLAIIGIAIVAGIGGRRGARR